MILDKKIKIKSHNVSYYTNKGYPPHKRFDIIEIDPNDLPNSSHYKVHVKCDVCLNEKKISWNKYYKNYKKYNLYTCSNKCAIIKNKKTNLDKYGEETPLLNKEIIEKTKKTNIEKYGSEKYIKSDDFIKKSHESKLTKYGSIGYNNIKKILKTKEEKYSNKNYNNRNKFKTTSLEKYGETHPTKSEIIKSKIKKTNLEKYGFHTSLLNEETKSKIRKTNLEKYGNKNVLSSETIREKIKKTNLEKYGEEVFSKSEKYKKNIFQKINLNLLQYGCELINRDDHKNIIIKHKTCGKTFTINYKTLSQRIGYINYNNDITLCTHCSPLKSVSVLENEIFEFIKLNYSDKIIKNYRNSLEIDIYLPELKLGFEFNGLYWHSELFKEKKYHLNKTEYFMERGINIIHIWEDEWVYKKEIVKSMILNKLKKTPKKIYARKCNVKIINDVKEVKEFINRNHIQGYSKSSIKLGLYYGHELVSVMTFGERYTNKKREMEIIRFCNKLNTTIVGAASKLFKYFIENFDFEYVISYADISHSTGNLYEILKFKKVSKSVPNYYWVIDNIRRHRFNYTKSKLIKKGYDKNLTEVQIMHGMGYYRIWGCGQLKFLYEKINL